MRKVSEVIRAGKGTCVLAALRQVLPETTTDEKILRVCRKHGYQPEVGGMYDHQWLKACEELGIEFGVGNDYSRGCFASRYDSNWGMEREYWKNTSLTLGQFCRTDGKKGTWLVTVRGHMLVVRDGVIVDHNYHLAGKRRRMLGAIEVRNSAAPIVDTGYVQFRARPKNARKPGCKAFHRYALAWEMARVCYSNERVPVEDLFLNTDYNKADFRWDIKQGNVIWVK